MLTSQDDVGHVVLPVPSPTTTATTVVLALVVEELLVLKVQTRLAVGEQLAPVRHAALVVRQELRGKQGSRVRSGVTGSGQGSQGVRSGGSQGQVRGVRGSDQGGSQGQVRWPHPSGGSDDVTTHLLRGLPSQLQAQVGVVQQGVEEGVLQVKGRTQVT